MELLNKKNLLLAGPCSVESREQLYDTIKQLTNSKVDFIRAGVWKPRTRPGSFEGLGEKALNWIKEVKEEFGVKFAIEVANSKHVEEALKTGIDLLWIGARTTVNPFAVQNIADALKGLKIPVMVKNPINPDLGLWLGAIERLQKVGLVEIMAIHRGFSSYKPREYRNDPIWNIAIDFKVKCPNIPLICDPSHIAGKRKYLFEIAQEALDLDFDGLMIEVHNNPAVALSDSEQQLTPKAYDALINKLEFRKKGVNNENILEQVKIIRKEIDFLDRDIVNFIEKRMELIMKSAKLRLENNIPILQIDRWEDIEKSRPLWLKNKELDPEMIRLIFKTIKTEAIKMQLDLKKNHKL